MVECRGNLQDQQTAKDQQQPGYLYNTYSEYSLIRKILQIQLAVAHAAVRGFVSELALDDMCVCMYHVKMCTWTEASFGNSTSRLSCVLRTRQALKAAEKLQSAVLFGPKAATACEFDLQGLVATQPMVSPLSLT